MSAKRNPGLSQSTIPNLKETEKKQLLRHIKNIKEAKNFIRTIKTNNASVQKILLIKEACETLDEACRLLMLAAAADTPITKTDDNGKMEITTAAYFDEIFINDKEKEEN